jgi:hypothetical protein
MGFFSFFNNIFGGSPAQSGGSVIVTGSQNGDSGGYGGGELFPTTLSRSDTSMLRQFDEALKYRRFIEDAASETGLPGAVICGIGSRESHWGLALKPPVPGGTGDFANRRPRGSRRGRRPPDGGGFGRGLMQIDYDWHEFARTGNWQDPQANLMYASKVLNDAKQFFQDRGVPADKLMRAVIAAYNAGATATYQCYVAHKNIDCNTTGRDYSEDVLNRAGWFQLQGWR